MQAHRRDWALSAAQRIDARLALRLLEGSGLSLERAAQLARASVAKAERSVPLHQAVAAFLRHRREANLRDSTIDWYDRELGAFAAAAGDRTIDAITRREVREYLDSRRPGVRPAVFRCVRALFRFGAQREPAWVAVDPTLGMKVASPRRDVEVPVLTVAQSAKLLAAAPPEYVAPLALALFAGLRPEEIAGRGKDWLPWSAINEQARTIVVPGAIAKTRKPGKLEGLPDALWPWLATVKERGPTVARSRFQQISRWGRSVLRLKVWPKDVTRHTFASFATHLVKDPGRVALWLRHEGNQRVLYRHYLNVNVSEADAQAFFALRPAP